MNKYIVTLSFQIVVAMNHGHYEFLLRSAWNEISTTTCSLILNIIRSSILKLFTLINQNRSQILIIYYVDKQSWIIYSNVLFYIHVLYLEYNII